MNAALRPLRTLVGVRERAQTRLEEALATQRALLRERQAACEQAAARRAQCAADEGSAAEQRRGLLEGHFMPQNLMALDLRLKAMAADTAQADQALAKARQAAEEQHGATCAAQRTVRRNAQRIETFTERIASLLREHEYATEQAVDEETGETFTARWLARRRADQEAQRHG